MNKTILVSLLIVLLGLGCASAPVQKQPGPKAYYDKAMEQMKGGGIFGTDYESVRRTLNQIVDNYPYSLYAQLAQLRIADTYYKEGKYLESAEAYDHFVKMYPNNTDVPYALFMEGKSFIDNQRTWLFKSLPDDTDEAGIYNALDEFRYIVRNYPDSKYAGEAGKYVVVCETVLADHDLYIADFYLEHDQYEAAIGRLQDVYKRFPDSGIGDKALYKLAIVYKSIHAPDAYRQIVDLLKRQYPDSKYVKKL